MITETEWKRRTDLRAEWEAFQNSEAFKSGVEVLRNFATPFVHPGESAHNLAVRQSYQAGYHACLHLLTKLPVLHTKDSTGVVLREWDWVGTEQTTDT